MGRHYHSNTACFAPRLATAHTRNLMIQGADSAIETLADSGGHVADTRSTHTTEQRLVRMPDGRKIKITLEDLS